TNGTPSHARCEFDSEHRFQIRAVSEAPHRVHAATVKPTPGEKRFHPARVVVRQVRAHPVAVRRASTVQIHDHERTTRPQDSFHLGQSGLTTRTEKVCGARVHHVHTVRPHRELL